MPIDMVHASGFNLPFPIPDSTEAGELGLPQGIYSFIPFFSGASGSSEDQPMQDLHAEDGVPRTPSSLTRTSVTASGGAACKRCRRMKMKCVYSDDTGSCSGCSNSGHSCTVAPSTRVSKNTDYDELIVQSRRQDKLIAVLAQYLTSATEAPAPQHAPNILAQVADPHRNLHSETRVQPPASTGLLSNEWETISFETPTVGIIQSGVIRSSEVPALFAAYFRHMNSQLPLLDPGLHQPSKVLERSNFLFTVICAVASRFFPRPEVYARAISCAYQAAGEALISGVKSLQLCQAYLILGEFSPRAASPEEDRASLFRGIAIRLACDLNLGSPMQQVSSDHAIRDRERTWLACAWLDLLAGGSSMPRGGRLILSIKSWALATDIHRDNDFFLAACVDIVATAVTFGELVEDGSMDGADEDVALASVQFTQNALFTALEEWRAPVEGIHFHWLSFLSLYCGLRFLAMVRRQQFQNPSSALATKTWTAITAALEALAHLRPLCIDDVTVIGVAPAILLDATLFVIRLALEIIRLSGAPLGISITPEVQRHALKQIDKILIGLGSTKAGSSADSPPATTAEGPARALTDAVRTLHSAVASAAASR